MKKLIACLASGVCLATAAAWHGLQSEKSVTSPPVVVAAEATMEAPGTTQWAEFLPLPFPTGYGGTADVRGQSTEGEGTAQASSPKPVQWGRVADESEFPAVVSRLSRAVAYGSSLRHIHELAGEPDQDWAAREDGSVWLAWQTRFQTNPDRMTPLFMQALDTATGIPKQNLIFQLALTLPDEVAFPKLREIQDGTNPADTEDALCALAFRGDPGAVRTFELLAANKDEADCNILCDGPKAHDELARQGKREILRSYRCIELLDFRPYFHLHAWSYMRGDKAVFSWADEKAQRTTSQRRALAKTLLPHWLNRYSGHPGSDDMAWRLSRTCEDDGEYVEAARWASRCATFPDQDMTAHGVAQLIELAECRLERWQLAALLDGPDWQRNRQLVEYIELRRLAVEDGFQAALDAAEFIAATEPDSLLAGCFRSRWACDPPRGLTSGVDALAKADALFSVYGEMPRSQYYLNPVNYWAGSWEHMTSYVGATPKDRRLNPPADAVQLPTSRLTAQFRTWATLADLQERRDALEGDARADMEYKIAAVYYHERDAIFPVYAANRVNSGVPNGVGREGERLTTNFASLRRAADLFEKLAADWPNWQARDKAIYSAALAWIKLVDYRPVPAGAVGIRNGVSLFEQLVSEHPDSTLSDDAYRAAAYWRRVHSHAWNKE
ncbi:MAG: hypothetical protein K8I27_12010 [Planctomycetes bacterium]|nr:hypothetical protein [Planctomycetota bacterium]